MTPHVSCDDCSWSDDVDDLLEASDLAEEHEAKEQHRVSIERVATDGGAEYAWIVACPHDERIVVEDDLEAAVLDGQGVYDVTIAGIPDTETAATDGDEPVPVTDGGAAPPKPIDEAGFGLIEALEESTAHADVAAYVRHARQAGGTGLLGSMHTFHSGGDGDIARWREVGTRKENLLWDEGAEVALEEVGNWDVTNKPILEKIADGDRGFVEPEHPAPEVQGFDVEFGPDGDTQYVAVTIEYWDQDDTRTVSIDFRVSDNGVAKLKSQALVAGRLSLENDLVPLIAAGIALEDQNFPGIDRVRDLGEYVDGARAEAQRIDLGDRDD